MGENRILLAFLLLACVVESHGEKLEIGDNRPKDVPILKALNTSGLVPSGTTESVSLPHSNITSGGEGGTKEKHIETWDGNSTQVDVPHVQNGMERVGDDLKSSEIDNNENQSEGKSSENSESVKVHPSVELLNRSVPVEVHPVGKRFNFSQPNAKHNQTDDAIDGRIKKEKQQRSSQKETQDEYLSDVHPKNDNSGLEECDASDRCTDEKNDLIACLRVPGNESPDLSLLIQNKGTKALTIDISAPSLIELEKISLVLKEKANEKVKVSIRSNDTYVNRSVLLLTSGDGKCSLNLPGIFNTEINNHLSPKSYTATKFLSPNPIMFFLLASALIICGGWIFFRFHGKGSAFSYQQLHTGLPISSGGRTQSDTADGWDENWGDNWDDEEAAPTSLKPVQSLSSDGLASRRSNYREVGMLLGKINKANVVSL